jgi:hypothetical protein
MQVAGFGLTPLITRLVCDYRHSTYSGMVQNIVRLAELGRNTVHKIANIDLTPLEDNLSACRKIITLVVLALALVGGSAVAMTVHSHQAISCSNHDGC